LNNCYLYVGHGKDYGTQLSSVGELNEQLQVHHTCGKTTANTAGMNALHQSDSAEPFANAQVIAGGHLCINLIQFYINLYFYLARFYLPK